MDAEPGYEERVARVFAELRSLGDAPVATLPPLSVLQDLVAAISTPGATLLDLTAATGLGDEETVDLIGDLGGFVATQIKDLAPDQELPEGLAKAAPRRTLGRQVAALRSPDANDANVTRWLMRRSTQMRIPLGTETVAMVHRIVQLGRSDEIDQLVLPGRGNQLEAINYNFAALIIAAFDFLEGHRAASVAALVDLLNTDPTALTADDIESRLVDHRWIAEAPIARLVSRAGSAPPSSITPALEEFRSDLLSAGGFLVPDVAGLNDGQVVRLMAAQGLELDGEVVNRLDREAIRLVDTHGFKADRDQLQPPVHKALVAGLRDEAIGALEARARGELDWAAEYNDAVAAQIQSMVPTAI